MAKRFTRLYKEPGYGMRFFSDELNPGKIAVADNSGPTPDQTDDGNLLVDPSRPLEVYKLSGGGYSIMMGVTNERGEQYRAGCMVEGALFLLEQIPKLECKLPASLQALAKLINVAKDRQPRES